MSNSISFVGRLGRDAEVKEVGSNKVLEMNVANNTGFGDKKNTNWFRCTLWGARGEKIASYLTKGKEVYISGELNIRKYDKDGVEKFSHDVNVNNVDFISGGGNESSSDNSSDDEDAPF